FEPLTLSLRVFISCLDQQSLPRILQVCSGVYFQGSIYELSGSEVCLSTGDLVKIIGLELLSVSCEEIETGVSLPLHKQILSYPSFIILSQGVQTKQCLKLGSCI
uniref:CABIT domain-containing protein n=1 Tax=Sinocyclocheilus anshuiensis TaxID=1608454 RepID=A0A671PCJ9_9TELE